MPKIKTNRGAAKRFQKSASGRIKRARAYHNHILTKKDPRRKRRLQTMTAVAEVDAAMVRRMIPYL